MDYQTFILDYPRFEQLPQERVERVLVRAINRMPDPNVWGAVYDEAIALLAAHLLQLQENDSTGLAGGNAVGAVQSINIAGEGSISFAAASGGSNAGGDYARTSYGLQLLELQKRTILAARIV